jgi:DNA modification methylase
MPLWPFALSRRGVPELVGGDHYPAIVTKARMTKNGGPTRHLVREGDARDLSFIETGSVHLVVTSPPYAMLKEYPDHQGQLGNMPVYDEFLDELDEVWR